MLFSYALTLFASFSFPLASGQSACVTSNPCLSSAEATNIAIRYLTAFQTDSTGAGTGAALINSTFGPTFTYYDEGASFGVFGPVYHNRSELTSVITSSGYSGSLVTGVTYTLIDSFSSCNMILTRWISESKSANGTNVTVPVGTPIRYKGNDYLAVDLSTRLLYNATSSSDLLNYYTQLGDDVIASDPGGQRSG